MVNRPEFVSDKTGTRILLAWGEEAIHLQTLDTPSKLHEQIASDFTGTFAHTVGAIPSEGDPTITRPAGT